MSEERLKELLCQADEAAGAAPELGDGLARQVRRRAARRRKVTLAAPAALAAVLMIGIGLAFWVDGDSGLVGPGVSPGNESVDQIRMELVRLTTEVEVHRQVVRELQGRQVQQEELARLEAQLAAIPDPLEEVRRQVEQAAYTIYSHAELRYGQMDLQESAIKDMEQIVKFYPQTRWARVAQDKLNEIRSDLKGTQ